MIRSSNRQDDRKSEIINQFRCYRSKIFKYQACKDLYDNLFPNGTQVLNDMPKAQSTDYEPERWALKRIALQDQMQKSLDEQRIETQAILEMICDLGDNEKTVIIRRYMVGESMETVANKLSYSVKWCWNTHNRAINQIAESENYGRI